MLSSGLILPVVVGFGIAVSCLGATIRRIRLVRGCGENGVARLTLRRAIRYESVAVCIHFILLISIVMTLSGRETYLTPSAAAWAFMRRTVISVLLSYVSVTDLWNRKKIAYELSLLSPEKHGQTKMA